MSEAVAPCTQPLFIQLNAAAAGLPVLEQDTFACVRMLYEKKPSELLTRLFIHFMQKMLSYGESWLINAWRLVRPAVPESLFLHPWEAEE